MRYEVKVNNYGQEWYKDAKFHRLYGPAIEYKDDVKYWYKNDKEHRLDGPARESFNGYKSWWLNGVEYTEAEFKRIQSGKK